MNPLAQSVKVLSSQCLATDWYRLFVIFFIFLSSCTTATYDDGSIPSDKVIKISSIDTYIATVDDKEVPYSGANFATILVLPGVRKIGVHLNQSTGYARSYSMAPVTANFIAKEGHEYITQPRFPNDGKWFPIIFDKTDSIEVQISEQEAVQAVLNEVQAVLTEANTNTSTVFLAKNAAKKGVVMTKSGLQYEVITEGIGPKPSPEDTVEVHYRGTLADGSEFDSTYKRGEPATFGVWQVIPGWSEALQLMPKGSKWKLVIPSELAYGAGGAGNVIGPNAALVFEVELIDIPSQERNR